MASIKSCLCYHRQASPDTLRRPTACSSLREVYLFVKANPGIKIKKVAQLRGKAESTVEKQLRELKKKGVIGYRGANKTGGYYVPKYGS